MKVFVFAASALVVLGLSGCVAQPDAAPTSPPAATASPAPTATTTPEPEQPQFVAVDPTLFFLDSIPESWGSWDSQDVNFVSPDGNLGCAILGADNSLRWGCKIGEKAWEFPSASAEDFCFDAQVSCGQGIEAAGTELPHPWFRSDPGFPATFAIGQPNDVIRVLNTGESVTFGDVTCYSEETDIRCENAASGHGFVISETRNEIF